MNRFLFRDFVRVDGTGAASIMEVSFQEVSVLTEEQDNQSDSRYDYDYYYYCKVSMLHVHVQLIVIIKA